MIRIACAFSLLILTIWFGLKWSDNAQPREVASAAIAPPWANVISDLPDTPDEWEGRIDYRALDQQFAELAMRPEMAGLAVAIVEEGELRFVRTYGVADRSTGAPVTPDTVFRWASVSKTVTGMLAAKLAADGKVDLDRPVASWNGTLRLPENGEARISFAQLLAQQTGLTKNAYDERLESGEQPSVLRTTLANAPLQCQPGTCHTYQNIAFDAASEILSQSSGMAFADAASRSFFRPLGMASAGYGMDKLTGAKDWARPYNGSAERTLRENYWRVPAAAGVDSNIVDFARWLQAVMGERPDILSAKALRIAREPRVTTGRLYGGDLRQANKDGAYGLGWRSFSYGDYRLEGHSGSVDGYRATLIFEPETRTGVVAMWNSNWGWPFRIPFAVIDAYHQRADSNWLDLGRLPPARISAKRKAATRG